MSLMGLMQSPIIGVAGGAITNALFGSSVLSGDWIPLVKIISLLDGGTEIFFQFYPEWSEKYSNDIQEFAPVKGSKSYPVFAKREGEKFSLASEYYARNPEEGMLIIEFADTLVKIASVDKEQLPIAYVLFPFKSESIPTYIENLTIEYDKNYIINTQAKYGSSLSQFVSSKLPSIGSLLSGKSYSDKHLPRSIKFSLDLVKYEPLPEISSSFSDILKTTNWNVSNSRRGLRSSEGRKSSPGTEQRYLECVDEITEDE